MKKKRVYPGALLQASNGAVAQAVAKNKNAIGYIGIGYLRDGVKPLNIASKKGSAYVSPLDQEAVEDGRYPLTRPLYQYTNGMPVVGSLAYNFLKFELSDKGENITRRAGYYPPNTEDKANNDEKFRMIERKIR